MHNKGLGEVASMFHHPKAWRRIVISPLFKGFNVATVPEDLDMG